MKETSPEVLELVNQGKALYSVENFDEALNYLQKAISMDPYCEAAYENLGVCYIMMDRFDDARAAFQKYLLVDKKCGLMYFHLGSIALLENKTEEGKAMYSKAELLGYNNPIMSLNLIAYYEELGEYDRCLEQYAKLLRANPYAYDIMSSKTELLLRIERYEDALASAKKMVQTDIDRFEGHHFTYLSLILVGKQEDAKTYIAHVLERFPDNETAKFDSLRLLDMTGEIDKALDALNEYFPGKVLPPEVATLKLGLLLQKERVDEALALMQDNPQMQEDSQILVIVYSLYFSRNDFQSALNYSQKLLDLEEETPQHYAGYYFRALAENKLGMTDKAQAHLKEAVQLYKKICLNEPDHVDLYMYRALCEYQLGNYTDAVRHMEYLLAIAPKEADIHLASAMIYEAAGDNESAAKHRGIAAELDPDAAMPPL